MNDVTSIHVMNRDVWDTTALMPPTKNVKRCIDIALFPT